MPLQFFASYSLLRIWPSVTGRFRFSPTGGGGERAGDVPRHMPGVRRSGAARPHPITGRRAGDCHLPEVQTRLAPRLRTIQSRWSGGIHRLV